MDEQESKELDTALKNMEQNLDGVMKTIDALQKGQKKSTEAGVETMQQDMIDEIANTQESLKGMDDSIGKLIKVIDA